MDLGGAQPGAIFAGSYRILHPLGQGGMGSVFVAEQLATGAKRALKLLHRELCSDERVLRLFQQEARVGHRIESDHVVDVIDAGIDAESGIPWLAMELLEGEDLRSLLEREGALPLPKASAILDQIGHALAAAHDVGVVHRDLKPENVFLVVPRRDGADVMVKLLDFGIAKVVAENRSGGTMPMGTPLWMAPEQLDVGRISPATDVWAFGLVAFRVLTGRDYWTSASGSVLAVLREIASGPLESASARARELGLEKALPRAFDA